MAQGLTFEESARWADEFAHHVGLRRLFQSHSDIAQFIPGAFRQDPELAGRVSDSEGRISNAVEVLKVWFDTKEGDQGESAIANLNAKPPAIIAFVKAVGDIHYAARVNARLAEVPQRFGDRVISHLTHRGLQLEGCI
jgi:hypothetical protein